MSPLLRLDGSFACSHCNSCFPCDHGVPDLLRPRPNAGAPLEIAYPTWTHKPLCLDVGCGPGTHRRVIEADGFEWCGIDIAHHEGLTAIADAHQLPFENNTFDRCLLAAVIQHMRRPWIAMREIRRCCRPGASISGYVAFLEPEHGMSCFHMTRLGLSELLADGGFRVVSITPAGRDGLTARLIPAMIDPSGGVVYRAALVPMRLLSALARVTQRSQVAIAAAADRLRGRYDPPRNERRAAELRDRFAVGFNFVAIAD